MTIQATIQTTPSPIDASALCHVHQMLTSLIAYFGEDTTIINSDTGEVVEMNELPRVLGILSAISVNTNWEIRK